MQAFGERLKQEREKRGISLEEISLATKISTRMLGALEEEKFERLPGGIFNRGFVRAYARQLGLDEDEAVAEYLSAAGEAEPNSKSSAVPPPIVTQRMEASDAAARIPFTALAGALLLVALVLAVWNFYSHRPAHPPRSASTPAGAADSVSRPNSEPVQALSPEAAKALPETGQLPAAKPVNTAMTATTSREASPGTFIVLVRAREDSWLSIEADGKEVVKETLIAPAQRAVSAHKEVVIKAGNVGALDLSFNGRSLPAQGSYGEVKTLTFGSQGLQSAAPNAEPASPEQVPPE